SFFCKSPESKDRFVREPRTRYNAGTAAVFLQLVCNDGDRFIPSCRDQFPAFFIANHRRLDPITMADKSVGKTRLDVQELAVQTVNISVARNDPMNLTPTRTNAQLHSV